jgi:predicted metal-dependent TIM-barrel fold hydrolase
MDVLKEHKFDPARCVIDHNNEETARDVLDRGYGCAFSIYPQTKMGSEHRGAGGELRSRTADCRFRV